MLIAMTVFNTCHADARVLREADTLAQAGHHVRIFAISNRTYPAGLERLDNGVEIHRVEITSVLYVGMGWLAALYHLARGTRRLRSRPRHARRIERTEAEIAEALARMPAGARLRRRMIQLRARCGRAYRLWLRRVYLRSHRVIRGMLLKVHRPSTISSFWRSAGPAIQGWRPDVVHAHDGNTLPLGARTARALDVPLIYDTHELWRHRNRGDRLAPIGRAYDAVSETLYIRRATAVITVSPGIVDWLMRKYRLSRVHLVRNTPARQPVDSTAPSLRAMARVDPQDRVVLYTGRITSGRGIEETIEVLDGLPSDVHLVMLGYGDQLYVEGLLAMAEARGVQDRVRLAGAVPHEQVSAVAAQADVSVVAVQPTCLSYRYALPNKLFEAIQAGVPVVASDLPDLGDLVRGYGVGVTCATANPLELRKAIEDVLDSRQAFGDNIRVAAAELCWESEQHELLRMYEQLPAPARSTGRGRYRAESPVWRSSSQPRRGRTCSPTSGSMTTSCAAATPPASRSASTGTLRLTTASAIGPSS